MIPEVGPVGLTMLIIFVAVAVIVIKAIIRSLKAEPPTREWPGPGGEVNALARYPTTRPLANLRRAALRR
jgi:hypothetical protein